MLNGEQQILDLDGSCWHWQANKLTAMPITALKSLLVRHNSLRSLFIYQKQMLILTKTDQNPVMY